MEGECYNLICFWMTVFVALFFCHTIIGKNISQGITKLLSLIPIICLFLLLPLNLTTIHFVGLSSFFIAWLANFKLLLFAFGKGPLSNPSNTSLPIPLHHFVPVACFPITFSNKPSPSSNLETNKNPSSPKTSEQQQQQPPSSFNNKGKSFNETSNKSHKSSLSYAIKILAFSVTPIVYDSKHLHPMFKMSLFCLVIYLSLDVLLAMFANLTKKLVRVEIGPQFDKPHLATSVQNFWGKRWNLMVSSILRLTVYSPLCSVSTRLKIPKKWSSLAPVFITFLVSGLMHELIFYHIGRIKPSWEVTCFFTLQGLAVDIEIILKKKLDGKFKLHPIISRTWALGFVMGSSFWFFFPPLLRFNPELRACKEIVAALKSLRHGKLIGTYDVSCPFDL